MRSSWFLEVRTKTATLEIIIFTDQKGGKSFKFGLSGKLSTKTVWKVKLDTCVFDHWKSVHWWMTSDRPIWQIESFFDCPFLIGWVTVAAFYWLPQAFLIALPRPLALSLFIGRWTCSSYRNKLGQTLQTCMDEQFRSSKMLSMHVLNINSWQVSNINLNFIFF